MMLKVHHLNKSRSHRILWLLEELGLPYEVIKYQRDPKTMFAPPELKAVHPLGKSPVLEDGDLKLAESAAIIEYLLDKHPNELRPEPGAPARAAFLYWLHFAEGSMMPPLVTKLYLSRVGEAAKPVMPRLDGMLADQIALIERTLAAAPWFAGDAFTAADIQMSYPVEAAAKRAGLDERFPATRAWLQRIAERPAYRRAREREGE